MRTSSYIRAAAFAAIAFAIPVSAQFTAPVQPGWLKGGNLIRPGDLPPEFEVALLKVGGRLMSAGQANVSMQGILTDANGTRPVQITVQAPGYMRFQDSANARVLVFDGSQFESKNANGGQADERVEESLLAYLPDSIFLQLAAGGSLRPLGGHFRTDDGSTSHYTGPYWRVYVFSPVNRAGLTAGQALQQKLFIAIDEQTGLLSEVRMVQDLGPNQHNVTQTQFGNWMQQGGQWFPGNIVRLENGQQVLSFQTQQASVGAQTDPTVTFQP